MSTPPITPPVRKPAETKPAKPAIVFGVNEIRLNFRQWCLVAAIVAAILWATPRLWSRIERFDLPTDYRIPYSLSQDYWLYQRRLDRIVDPARIVMLGDSVVWGEYVVPSGSLSHFMSLEAGQPDKFVNCGVNGLFPLAMEGLVGYYAQPLRHRKVILHCNVLWMTSPKADLSIQKEEKFNHTDLVPQFRPRIPCYKADVSARLSVVVERNVTFVSWVNHLQSAYFGAKSILQWTLQDDGNDPPRYPNSYKNPLAQIRLAVPTAPEPDPERGPASSRHRAWSANGAHPSQFEWVGLDTSLQWGAFRRVLQTLRDRDNQVLVVLGPFNEHLIGEESRRGYRTIRDGIMAWLTANQVPHVVPETLPSALYADASHPLTGGYALLARQLYQNPTFQSWLQSPAPRLTP